MNVIDEYSDLIQLYFEKNTDKCISILEKHKKLYGRLGFNPQISSIDFWIIFNKYLAHHNQIEISNETEFLKNIAKQDFSNHLKECFDKSLRLLPSKDYIYPKIVFLLNGPRTDGKVLDNFSFGLNLNNLYYPIRDVKMPNEQINLLLPRILSLIIHESNHIFIRQLDIPKNCSYFLFEIAFYEGLATYLETVHMPWHEAYLKEIKTWLKILINTANNNKIESSDLALILGSATFKTQRPDIVETLQNTERITDKDLITDIFVKQNGPIYHIGYYIWDRIYNAQGNTGLSNSILNGPHFVEEQVNSLF